MTNRLSRRAFPCALLATTCLCAPAYAQIVPVPPPPMIETVDANGVDLSRGDLALAGPTLSIGAGQSALGFSRSFSSTVRWDSTRGTVSQNGSTYTVNIGSSSEDFILSNGVYAPRIPGGSTLTYNSAAPSYTYTAQDGTVATFLSPSDITDEAGWPIASLVKPNGETLTFTRATATVLVQTVCYPGGCTNIYKVASRLQSVRSNLGYLLHIQYAGDTATTTNDLNNWFTRTKITLVNLGSDYCDPTAFSCTPSNPAQTLSISGNTYTDTAGRSLTLTSDASGRLATMRLPGHTSDDMTVAYDANNRVQSLTRQGVVTTYSYVDDTVNNVRTTTVTDALNHQWIYKFDLTNLQVKSKTDPLGRTTSQAYNASLQLQSVTAPEGNYVQYAYDSRGNVTQTTAVAKPGSGLANIVTSAVFPTSCTNAKTCNKPTSTTDARGNTTNYTYDPNSGGIASVTLPAPTAGAVQPQTRYSYSGLQAYYKQVSGGSPAASGQTVYLLTGTSACQTLNSCTGTSDETKTSISYGSQSAGTANNLLPVSATAGDGTGALAATTAVTYDNVGNRLTVDGPLAGTADTTRYRYDTDRELIGTISPNPGNGQPDRATRITYNPDGQVVKQEVGTVTDQSDTAWNNFSTLQTIDIGFDTYYRPITKKLSASGTAYSLTQTSYDADGRPQCTAVRMNTAVYGSLPSDACTLGTQGSYGPDQISKAIYDNAGQVTQAQVAVGTTAAANERTLTYSNNGLMTSVTDGENNKTTYVYDGFDRLSQTQYPSPTKGAGTSNANDYEQLSYDAASNVTSRRPRDGQTIYYGYDALNHLNSKDLPGTEWDEGFGYDNLGRLTSAVKCSGPGVCPIQESFTYDALGRQVSEAEPYGAVTRQFDLAGNLTRTTWWDGFYVTYDHLVTGEVSAIRENGATSGVGVLASYAYDNLGNRTSVTFGNGANQVYTYDPVSRLASLANNLAGTTNNLSATFSYTPANQLASTARTGDAYAFGGAYNVNRGYTSNGLNQYSVAGPAIFTYDAKGNLTSDGTNSYTYWSENMLKSAPGATLYYDQLHRLVEYDTSVSTRFVYDGANMAAEVNNPAGAIQKRYVFGPSGEPLVEYSGSGTTTRQFVSTDERGSVISLSDSSGNLIGINSYDEYGIPASTNQGRFGYTGQAWLSEIGLQYSRARIYSPTLGRFLQTDPIGYGDGPNWYAYTGNDPVNGTDPTGTAVTIQCKTIKEAVGLNGLGGPVITAPQNICSVFLSSDQGPPPQQLTPYQIFTGGSIAPATSTQNNQQQQVCHTQRMMVTSYNDHGAGSDWSYWKNHPEGVGPGTVAVANTVPKPYDYGTRFAVQNANGSSAYRGTALDTGAGWDAKHHNVDPSQWIDIWLAGKEAKQWGVQWRNVQICTAAGGGAK